MPSIAEWVLYTNFCSAKRAQVWGHYKNLLGTILEKYFQHKDEHDLGRCSWRGLLKSLHKPPIPQVLKIAYPYLHPTYEGEAILSVGNSRDMFRRGASGVVNVIPFTCMPGTIVNALMKRFR